LKPIMHIGLNGTEHIDLENWVSSFYG